MQNGVDIIERLLRGAMRRRAPLWCAVVLPWMVLASVAGVAAALAWIAWDFWRLRARVTRDWPRWLDGSVPLLEDSSALLVRADTPMARLQQQRILQRASTALSADVVASVAAERVRFDWRWFGLSVVLALGAFAAQHTTAGQTPLGPHGRLPRRWRAPGSP
jgi:hypothetical protein